MTFPLKMIGTLLLILSYSMQMQAHSRYVLPSHTQLSGDESQQVTLLASISNDVFHPDKPLGNGAGGEVNSFLANMFKTLDTSITSPDGTVNSKIKWRAFSRQSATDIRVKKPGTYRISVIQKPTALVTFKTPDGAPSRIFGNEQPLPSGSSDIVHHTVASRTEAFVTYNTRNKTALKSVGFGIELAGKTHPNDLFIDELAEFQLLLDGKPLKDIVSVHTVRSGTRHRNQRAAIESKTDATGKFTIVFKDAGMYLMEVEHTQKGTQKSGVDFHHNALYVTLEVFPQ